MADKKNKMMLKILIGFLIMILFPYRSSELDIKLIEAIKNDNFTEVKKLIKKDANVNSKDIFGFSALTLACSGDIKIVKLLIKNGANVNPDYSGLTPLMAASSFGDIKIVKLLIQNGADINIDNEGYTALFEAVRAGNYNIVYFLISLNADINSIEYSSGFSILMSASQEGYLKIVKLLIDKGANIHLRDKNNKNALDYAIKAYNQYKSVEDLEWINNYNFNKRLIEYDEIICILKNRLKDNNNQ